METSDIYPPQQRPAGAYHHPDFKGPNLVDPHTVAGTDPILDQTPTNQGEIPGAIDLIQQRKAT